jgi:hypothetical protein
VWESAFGERVVTRSTAMFLPDFDMLINSIFFTRGLGVTLYGYSPRLPSLATRVVREFGSLSFWEAVDPDIVANCKERMLRGLQSC